MKRTLWTIGMVAILGIASISCETSSSLEEVIVEDELTITQDEDKNEEQTKPGSN